MSNTHRMSNSLVFLENASLIGMYLSGIALTSLLWWPAGLIYLFYCLLSNLLVMVFICPYCYNCRTASCHSGYHYIARYFPVKKGKTFSIQFKRFIKVVYPLWILPILAAGYLLIKQMSWVIITLTALFCVLGVVIVPLSSRSVCQKCINGKNCPRVK